MLMNRDIQEDKMEQNEDLALLRAKTSIERNKKCPIEQKCVLM